MTTWLFLSWLLQLLLNSVSIVCVLFIFAAFLFPEILSHVIWVTLPPYTNVLKLWLADKCTAISQTLRSPEENNLLTLITVNNKK